MRVYLIGADFEENLGLGILAAVCREAGHEPYILPFNVPEDGGAIVERVMADQPELVGLSIQFQHRAHEFLGLARKLRSAGYRGHVTSGAQFPTLAYQEVIEGGHGVDSVVFHDGEETLLALMGALENGTSLFDVEGLALMSHDGVATRTAPRRMPDDLDAIPFPIRYRQHNRHMNVPFVPLLGGRGCWGKCNYCSIVAFYRDGREHGGGRLFRLRSPENIAAEIALLQHRAQTPCIFCFHDDNFTLPNPKRTLERMQAIRAALDEYGVGKVAFVGKARPDTITPELAKGLAELGVIRLYVGVENGSQTGGDNLRRGTQQAHVRGALKACREAGIFNCYNLLIFEPGASVGDVAENMQFIRDHADHPVNFCRAEPYHGTPLHLEMSKEQDLGGSYLGWNYRIADDKTELLFRVCSAAFRERNFAPRGVANRYMGIGYAANVLKRFYEGETANRLGTRARLLTRAISLDTADYLERAIDIIEGGDVHDAERIERHTARLALEVAASDRVWHEELDSLYADMNAHANEPRKLVATNPTQKLLKLARNVAFSGAVVTLAAGCECGMVVDPVPPDAGQDAGMVVDPAPQDAGMDAGFDAGTDSGMVVDPPPPDAAMDDAGFDAGDDAGMVVDPAPFDAAMSSLLPEAEDDAAFTEDGSLKKRLRLVDQWRDSAPANTLRTADLPMTNPPAPRLRATRADELVRVTIDGVREPFSTRWESDGDVDGDGPEVAWRPASETDQLRVAVRTRGGVAVVTLRATAV
ncbi:MAG: B12-binding domain-containing radical SAM protein [Sandaracinaceae bacterium]|nr:B12-binding domain-containing radical SAM protein [Sandaracinaceae bacterium]